jgi:hypothetical protein
VPSPVEREPGSPLSDQVATWHEHRLIHMNAVIAPYKTSLFHRSTNGSTKANFRDSNSPVANYVHDDNGKQATHIFQLH